jgi:GAF domain-containing protein
VAIDAEGLERSLVVLRDIVAVAEPPAGRAAPDTATLERVVEETQHLFGFSAGLMLRDAQTAVRCVAASDDSSDALERVQEEIGRGPCVDAALADRIVHSEDMQTDKRWPEVTTRLRPEVRGVLAVPVRLSGLPVGSLNVQCTSPHVWDDTEQQAMLSYAGIVEQALLSALASHQKSELVEQLEYALEHRVTVERAIGFLMSALKVDNVAAFNALRRTARSSRRTVSDVAQQVLSEGHL